MTVFTRPLGLCYYELSNPSIPSSCDIEPGSVGQPALLRPLPQMGTLKLWLADLVSYCLIRWLILARVAHC